MKSRQAMLSCRGWPACEVETDGLATRDEWIEAIQATAPPGYDLFQRNAKCATSRTMRAPRY